MITPRVSRAGLGALLFLALAAIPAAHAFTFLGSAWPEGRMHFHLRMGGPPSAPLLDGSTSWETPVIRAIDAWNATGAYMSLTYASGSSQPNVSGDGVNTIFFSSSIYGRAFGTSTLAVTTNYSRGNVRVEADIIFNTGQLWNSYRGPLRMGSTRMIHDVQRVAIHELGHAIGLGHPDQAGQAQTAIMNSTVSNNDALASDDAAGAITLYPPPGATFTLTTATSNGFVTRSPSYPSYLPGTSVTLTATPAPGFIFTGWSGAASGTTNPLTVTVSADATITANFAPAYALAVIATNGTVTRSPSQSPYPAGSTVTLTATPATGYVFTGWSGALTGSSNPATLTMTENKTVTANFARTYALTVTGTNGSVARSPDQTSYVAGTPVTLTATPASGYLFLAWSGAVAGSQNPITVTMSANRSVSASFVRAYSVSATGINGTVTRSPSQELYASGSRVTLTATPAAGYAFTGWSGGATGTINPLGLTVSGNRTVTANFVPAAALVVNATNGTVTRTPSLPAYPLGSNVSLRAVPATGYAFVGWSGAVTGTTNPVTLPMTQDATVTANFVPAYRLTTTATNGTFLRTPNLASYPTGTQVTITARPSSGYAFTGWGGDAAGTTNPVTVTMDGPRTVTATFQRAYRLTISALNGTVTQDPAGQTFLSGTSVTLAAHPRSGYRFVGWTGSLVTTANPVTLTMNADKQMRAVFTAETNPQAVARFETDAFANPAPGWRFLFNSLGPVGTAASYVPLRRTTHAWAIFDGNGVSGLPDPEPFRSAYLGRTENLSAYGTSANRPGGRPGPGSQQSAWERFVIAGYQVGNPGDYLLRATELRSITTSTDGLALNVYVDDRLVTSALLDPTPGAAVPFDADLGSLTAGQVIYVAIGGRGTDTGDLFTLRYTVERLGGAFQAMSEGAVAVPVNPPAVRLVRTSSRALKPGVRLVGSAEGDVSAVELRVKRRLVGRASVSNGRWTFGLRNLRSGVTPVELQGVRADGTRTAPVTVRVRRR